MYGVALVTPKRLSALALTSGDLRAGTHASTSAMCYDAHGTHAHLVRHPLMSKPATVPAAGVCCRCAVYSTSFCVSELLRCAAKPFLHQDCSLAAFASV